MDPRLAPKRGDLEARIVGESGESRCLGGSERLDRRVFGKGAAGLFRLRQVQLGGRYHVDAERLQELCDLPHLSRIMAGDQETISRPQINGHQATASFCSCTISAMPRLASAMRASN